MLAGRRVVNPQRRGGHTLELCHAPQARDVASSANGLRTSHTLAPSHVYVVKFVSISFCKRHPASHPCAQIRSNCVSSENTNDTSTCIGHAEHTCRGVPGRNKGQVGKVGQKFGEATVPVRI